MDAEARMACDELTRAVKELIRVRRPCPEGPHNCELSLSGRAGMTSRECVTRAFPWTVGTTPDGRMFIDPGGCEIRYVNFCPLCGAAARERIGE